MKRSAGVTVITILSLIGSAFTFAMGVVMLAVMVLAPAPHSNQFPGSPIFLRTILVFGALVYFLPAVWGIVTGIGLWWLKNWARISIIVFAVLLSVTGGFAGLTSFFVPYPVEPNGGLDPSVVTGIRIGMGLLWLTLLGIGIWWMIFFNRPKVKMQFVRPTPQFADASTLQTVEPLQNASVGAIPGTAERPLSITILAWLLLAGCVFMPLGIVLHAPAVLFTKLLTGWPAAAVFLVFSAIQLWIGIGLLRLKPAARMAAIIYFFVFGAVNTAIFYLAPGSHARLVALLATEQTMFPWMQPFQSQPQFVFDPTPMLVIGGVAGSVAAMIPLYFLITRKAAYEKAGADLGSIRRPFE